MPRNTTLRLAAVTLLLPVAVALTACGPSKNSSSASSSSSSSRSSSSSSAAPSSGSSGGGNCAAGFTPGQIAGQPKCLQNGQPCQENEASDYKKYGFQCTRSNGRYTLEKK